MRIGIVDDDTPLIENLRFLLQSEPGIEWVRVFGSAEELLQTQPWPEMDVLLVDMELPGLSGVELIALATERQPGLSCLAYTVSVQRQSVFAAIKAGACGYILKGGGFRELVSALHTIEAGGAPMSPGIARQVLLQFQQMVLPDTTVSAEGLSEREREVLQGLAQGHAYKEIATALSISAHTVNTHVKHIYEKLHVRSRGEAVRKARQRGWL